MMYEDITTDAELKVFENSEKFYLVVHYDPSIWAPELESRLEWDIREKKKSSIKFKDGEYRFNGMDDYEDYYLFNNKHEATVFMYEKKIEEAEAEIVSLKRDIDSYYSQITKTTEEQLKASRAKHKTL